MELRRKTRSGWEYFTIAVVIGCSLWISLALYAKRDEAYKAKLLITELNTMRTYVTAYTLEHHQHPSDLWSVAQGAWRNDPFGNPYQYNPKTGWVASTTSSYKHW